MRPLMQLAAVGVVAFTAWKVGSFFLFPMLFFALKIALIVGLVWFAIWFFKTRNDKGGASDSTST